MNELLRKLDLYGLEGWYNYPSIYRGYVVSTKDPEGRGRILAYSPEVGHTKEAFPQIWIDPLLPMAGTNRGSFYVPAVDDCVRIFYSRGNPQVPAGYLGGWYGDQEVPTELAPQKEKVPYKQGLVTRGGHTVILDDTPDSPSIKVVWHKTEPADPFRTKEETTANRNNGETSSFEMKADGSIAIQTADGVILTLKDNNILLQDDSGNKVSIKQDITITNEKGTILSISGDNVTIQGAGTTKVQAATITLDAPTINLGGGSLFDAVAKASSVTRNLNALKNIFNAWTPVPGDGGASLKALATARLTTFPESVGSTTVKVK